MKLEKLADDLRQHASMGPAWSIKSSLVGEVPREYDHFLPYDSRSIIAFDTICNECVRHVRDEE